MKERRDRRPRTRIGRRVSSPRPVTLERPGRGTFKLYSRFFNSAFAHNALSKSVDAITRALYEGEKGSATAHANRSPVSSPRPVTLERPGRGTFKLYSRFFWSSFFSRRRCHQPNRPSSKLLDTPNRVCRQFRSRPSGDLCALVALCNLPFFGGRFA